MPMRRVLLLGILLAALAVGGVVWHYRSSSDEQTAQTAAPIVIKRPVNFATRTFDPANPPADMPPLPPGENAECDSNFLSNAVVGGRVERTDATHGNLTVTQITVTLQLNITIWVPQDVSGHVMEHEEGHREISEFYYQTAEQAAGRAATSYMGRRVAIEGADLDAESNRALQQIGSEITDKYNKELNPNPTQLLYDSITDHSRNDVVAADAVAHALKNVSAEAPVAPGDR